MKIPKKLPADCNNFELSELQNMPDLHYDIVHEKDAAEDVEYLCSVCALTCDDRLAERK